MADLEYHLLRENLEDALPNKINHGIGGAFSYFKNRRSSPNHLSWIRVDSFGKAEFIEVDKFTLKHHCDLPARDIRLLDPLFVYPSTILAREKAIVVNLEQIRCIITADEVLLVNTLDSYVLQYVVDLQTRLTSGVLRVDQILKSGGPEDVFGRISSDCLSFEFRALEVAFEAVSTFLDSQAAELEVEAYPLLDELTSQVSTLNLERVRRLKSRLVALTRRVQKVRDEIEQLMDDDEAMAEICLTEKKRRMDSSFSGDQSLMRFRSKGPFIYAPVSPISTPPDSDKRLKKSSTTIWSRRKSMKMRSSESSPESLEELEMLLESYFVAIDTIMNSLITLKEYIDDTQDFINTKLDSQRNQLIQFELLVTTTTFALTIFGSVLAIFGMNFDLPFFDNPTTFIIILTVAGICGIFIFSASVGFLKYKKLMPS